MSIKYIIKYILVPIVVSVEMILLLLLERQRQNGFTGRRHTSSVHYFGTRSESCVKKKSIH